MKLRFGFLFLSCAALIAAGCGGGDGGNGNGNGDSGKSAKKDKPSKAEAAAATDRDNKEEAVDRNVKAFEKDDTDIGACRNLAMSYVALASPASTGDPDNPPTPPKDREKSMKKAKETLEQCRDLAPRDRDVQQMLASTYMGLNEYDKATELLAQLARTSKGDQQANSYYALGLAASNAQQLDQAITAWQRFVALAPPKDPRVPQIRQSIRALQAAKRQPQPAAEPAADGEDAKDSNDGEGDGEE